MKKIIDIFINDDFPLKNKYQWIVVNSSGEKELVNEFVITSSKTTSHYTAIDGEIKYHIRAQCNNIEIIESVSIKIAYLKP